ncbi:Rid family detoxifying hydrolase [Halodesulfovibrio marinisediminis]|uniref:2-iminobutanoate/2-iminopropanoate deaminase n=1 Tax=Halodesulfovibrio marinisediminis DSM 17456 TaxID=1121457 RepID=A0A1N6FBZ8_9BACT|nr:Rid family detoxifying hydrolase [Halodesulfovibrio marinisediminis]SIN92738.1 2-iminobutanoate/2-iminopropanoate deaminase [Halodesulfovibrio marinisediminis DSM 17456]SIN92780.1 2-iminobutanoate/2-iminopropanoate deaminase [Halodesulfovibrio marinisediminis DSM 17456]
MATVIKSDKAPAAAGPYSHAIESAGLIFTAGQLALDPETGKMVEGGAEAQARQALTNIKHVLESAGSSMDKVIKVTVFATKLEYFADLAKVYTDFFNEPFPARSGMEVSKLPMDSMFEIEVVAEK